MNLLSLDTSTEFLSLALQLDDKTYTHHQHAGQAASQLVLPQIQALLDTANVQLSDLDGIAFGAGPGAFTGVRVACGVRRGAGLGLGCQYSCCRCEYAHGIGAGERARTRDCVLRCAHG